ncbi:MAG: hypothetical protein AAFU79_03240 [Myxococcota bacterium]
MHSGSFLVSLGASTTGSAPTAAAAFAMMVMMVVVTKHAYLSRLPKQAGFDLGAQPPRLQQLRGLASEA